MAKYKKMNEIERNHEIFVTAHRGANAECPENTILAFQTAVDVGADLIEMDIHKTTDDDIVVIHDSTTKRVGNVALSVDDSSLADLQQVELGKDQRIPTLDEVFAEFKGKIGFVIEIKAKDLTDLLLEKITKHDVADSCIIISFKHEELSKFKQKNSEIPVAALDPTGGGWLTTWLLKSRIVESAVDNGFDGLHPLHNLMNKKFIDRAHKKNLFVNAWTADTKKSWKRLINADIDGITTNDPRGLIEYLNEK